MRIEIPKFLTPEIKPLYWSESDFYSRLYSLTKTEFSHLTQLAYCPRWLHLPWTTNLLSDIRNLGRISAEEEKVVIIAARLDTANNINELIRVETQTIFDIESEQGTYIYQLKKGLIPLLSSHHHPGWRFLSETDIADLLTRKELPIPAQLIFTAHGDYLVVANDKLSVYDAVDAEAFVQRSLGVIEDGIALPQYQPLDQYLSYLTISLTKQLAWTAYFSQDGEFFRKITA